MKMLPGAVTERPPQIQIPELVGRHNQDLVASARRLERGGGYRNLSTVCVFPTRFVIPARVLPSWLNLMPPMNQQFVRFPVVGMEVGAAYTAAVEAIIENELFKDFRYLLTLEEDNMPPPDGILKLFESIDGGVDGKKYDAVGGLYWTKGEGGQPMIYGNPSDIPANFMPQVPQVDTVQPCRGLGMGFTLFRLKMFRDARIQRPWFRTVQEIVPGVGARAYTQDLYFFENAGRAGYRFACDNRVRVGHYDVNTDIVW